MFASAWWLAMALLGSREDFADTEGPNASLQYGDAAQMAREQRALGSSGPNPGQQAGPQQGAQPSQNLGTPPQRPALPTGNPPQPQQQPPRDPMTREKARTSVFSDAPIPNIPWKLGITMLDNHPATGKVISALARRAREGR